MAYSISSGVIMTGITLYDEMAISSGGIASNITIHTGGSMHISSGGTANSTVNSGGSMHISSGGTANSTVNYRYMHISSGGTANSTVNTGSMYISSGGVANNTTVNFFGLMNIYSGGTANSTTVKSSGGMAISSGGTANSTTVNDYGYISISSGGVANSTTVNSLGSMHISSGGTANNTTVNSWGSMHISSGGTANSTTVNSAGIMAISSGGTATNIRINNYGYLTILSGGTASILFNPWGEDAYITSADGAVVNYQERDKNIYLGDASTGVISSGNTFSATIVSSGIDMFVYSGGSADNTTILAGGDMCISSGGTANSTVNSGGSMHISSGGTANSTVNYRYMYISSGGVADSTTVDRYGSMFISSGGTATNIKMENYGYLAISSGGTASILFNPWGEYANITSDYGAVVNYQERDKNIYLGNASTGAISSGNTFSDTIVSSGLDMLVYSGGSADNTTILAGGSMYVSSGGVVSNTAGTFTAYQGAIVDGFVVSDSSALVNTVWSNSDDWLNSFQSNQINLQIVSGFSAYTSSFGASFTNTTIHSGAFVSFYQPITMANVDTTLDRLTLMNGGELDIANRIIVTSGDIQGIMTMDSGSILQDSIVHSGGILYVDYRAKAKNITAGTSGNIYIGMAGKVQDITIDGGNVHVATGGMISDVEITDSGKLYLYGGAILDGEINVNGTMVLDDMTVNNGNINFVLGSEEESSAPMLSHLSRIDGGSLSVTVNPSLEAGSYLLAGDAADFDGSLELRDSSGNAAGSLASGEYLTLDETVYTLHNNGDQLSLEAIIQAYKKSISWENSGYGDEFTVEISTDNFETVLRITADSGKLDNYLPGSGVFQWRVSFDGSSWINGNDINSTLSADPEKLFSDADGDKDLFFARANGVWESGYVAGHYGILNGWQGTGETVFLDGKNNIADVFSGSSDANVLLLTDDDNGDALFVDDIFTSFGSNAARLAQIDEIRAGSGDDIIDMTSQNFAYSGSGVTIYGGLGDDTIWANNGNNILFGDAGNDRLVGANGDDILIGGSGNDSMHGGGGDDTFCFGTNWGNDTVEQLKNGSVTLHFENGSMDNWNAETLTYTDGSNSVTISGTTQIKLVFGGTSPVDGAFADSASEKIFEDKNKGMIA